MRFLFLYLIFGLFSYNSFSQVDPNGPDYVIVYIETSDFDRVAALENELNSYSNKVVSAKYDKNSHQLTVYYTPLMRDDTIFQIVFKYFDDFKKVAGTHIISNG